MTEATHIVPDAAYLGPATDFIQGVAGEVFSLGGWEAVAGCSLSIICRVLLAQEGFSRSDLHRGIAAALANNGAAALSDEARILMIEDIEDHLAIQIEGLAEYVRSAPGGGHA